MRLRHPIYTHLRILKNSDFVVHGGHFVTESLILGRPLLLQLDLYILQDSLQLSHFLPLLLLIQPGLVALVL